MLGLKRGTVKLREHHEEWARLFVAEKKLLKKTLNNNVVAIEHVGSTAISGVPAKPIIDIRIAVLKLNDQVVEKIDTMLSQIGYFLMHKYPSRYFFAKGPEECRTHHISLVEIDDKNEWKNTILFRDYLRSNKNDCVDYSNLKTKLAEKFATDRTSYTAAKENYIQSIIKKAIAEEN